MERVYIALDLSLYYHIAGIITLMLYYWLNILPCEVEGCDYMGSVLTRQNSFLYG